MRLREFIMEDTAQSATAQPWARSDQRDLIDMILNSVSDHPDAWREAAREANSIPGFREKWQTAYDFFVQSIQSRRAQYAVSYMKHILWGGESDGESAGGVKRIALGGALAALLADRNNRGSDKTAYETFRQPLSKFSTKIIAGRRLYALLYVPRLVYERIKKIEADQEQQRARGITPRDTVDGRLNRELDRPADRSNTSTRDAGPHKHSYNLDRLDREM